MCVRYACIWYATTILQLNKELRKCFYNYLSCQDWLLAGWEKQSTEQFSVMKKNKKKAQHHISCKQGILVTRKTGYTRIIQCTFYIFNSPDQLAIYNCLTVMNAQKKRHSFAIQIHWSFKHFFANAILVNKEWLQLRVAISCQRIGSIQQLLLATISTSLEKRTTLKIIALAS